MESSRFFLDAYGFYDDFKYDPKTISLYDKIVLKNNTTNIVIAQRTSTLLDSERAMQFNINPSKTSETKKVVEKFKQTKSVPMKDGEIRFIVRDKLSAKFFMIKLFPLGYFEIKETFDNIESFANIIEEVRALLSIALKEKVTILKYNYNRIIKLENHRYFKKFRFDSDNNSDDNRASEA